MMSVVGEFICKHQLQTDIKTRYVDLASEIGELGKEILKSTEYGKKDFSTNPQVIDEVGDCLFSLFVLCHELGIDAHDVLSGALKKYEKRFANLGDIGSGR